MFVYVQGDTKGGVRAVGREGGGEEEDEEERMCSKNGKSQDFFLRMEDGGG